MRRLALAATLVAACTTPAPSVEPECQADADCKAPANFCLANRCLIRVTSCEACPGGACNATCIAGLPGPAGERGLQGVAGPQGPTGAPGGKGDVGTTGPQGATGAQGATGLQGIQGVPGALGPQGPAGPQGATGLQGAAGPQGPTGTQGATGPAGATGAQGATGSQGVAGPQGATGPQGLTGAQGSTGPQGVPGSQGATGPQGAAGTPGSPGPQGVAGVPGTGGNVWGEEAATFAGFTSAPVNGAMGSRFAMNASCAAAFAGSHLCHASEYHLSNSATPVPAAGAWLDVSVYEEKGSEYRRTSVASPKLGFYTGQDDYSNCNNWSQLSYVSYGTTYYTKGTVLYPNGATNELCSTSHLLACCSSPFKERFRGYTAATVNGAQGGAQLMHFKCGQEFPGSHLCHASEFSRAHPVAPPPTIGAWLDTSVWPEGGSEYRRDSVASRDMGRYSGQDDYSNCNAWTQLSYVSYGTTYYTKGQVVTPAGWGNPLCSELHPLACCQ